MIIPELKTEEWIEVLEPFQQELLNELLTIYTEEDAMQIWLEVSGPEHTASFGGSEKNNYLKAFKQEFDKLLLGDAKYEDIIKEYNEHLTVSKFFVVSFLSTALSNSLGLAAGVVAPLIVLILGTIGKIGLNAYKSNIRQE